GETDLLMNGPGHGGAEYQLLTPDGDPGCDATYALWQYFLSQVDDGDEENGDESELLGSHDGLTLDLCDLADALRAGEIDLTPYSGSVVLEFDCEEPAVRDFI